MSETKSAVEVLPTQNSTEKFGQNMLAKPTELKNLLASSVFEKMGKMEASPINIAMQYYDFQQGTPVRFVFLGVAERPSPETGEMMNSVVLVDEKRDTFCNMSAILVGTFIDHRIAPGTPVEITRIGEKKTTNGRAYTWRVLPLIQSAN